MGDKLSGRNTDARCRLRKEDAETARHLAEDEFTAGEIATMF